MKIVLGLAVLCCFVIGSLGVGCPAKNCKNMLDCACKNKEDVRCPCLKSPEGGRVCIDGEQSPGTEAYYECEYDRIGGSPDRMCQRDGTWTGEEPTCSTVCGATDLNVETSSNFTLNRSGYLDEMDCTYTISGNGNPIVLSFSAFDLEWDFPEACNYDYLQINGSDATTFGKFCGDSNPGTFTSTGFTLHFHTDDTNTGLGFTMAYSYA